MNAPTLDDINRKYVSRTPQMVDCGMRVTAAERGRGTMTMPARADWVGDPVRNVLHPGALTVLADSACGLAVMSALPQRLPIATLDLRMDWLRPASPGHDLHCEAHCYRLARSVAFVDAEVWQDDRTQPIAMARATFMLSTPAGTRPGTGAPPPAPPAPASGWQPPAVSQAVQAGRPIPYADYLGIRVAPGLSAADAPLYRLPYEEKLIGNPRLPALHGGVVAGFAETAAMLHLAQVLKGTKLPKGVDFAVDYLRAARPVETFAQCELVRVGARVALVQVRCWQSGPDNPIINARGHFVLAAVEDGKP
jgi:uncharacterized protein (TIGR00369 family)